MEAHVGRRIPARCARQGNWGNWGVAWRNDAAFAQARRTHAILPDRAWIRRGMAGGDRGDEASRRPPSPGQKACVRAKRRYHMYWYIGEARRGTMTGPWQINMCKRRCRCSRSLHSPRLVGSPRLACKAARPVCNAHGPWLVSCATQAARRVGDRPAAV